ncbi:1449_t:CDS:2 [Funneliformis geosporum]|nr:1449_t:CDS:2 [Funneliformis geosporum]
MDTKQDLGMCRKNDEKEQGIRGDLQPIPSTIQNEQSKSFSYRPLWNAGTDVTNCLLVDHTRDHPIYQKTSNSDQRIVDIKQTKDDMRSIRGICCEPYKNLQTQNNQNETVKRPTLSSIPKRSEWKYNPTTRNMAVWKLRGNESVDCTIPSESESFNEISHYRCMEKKNQANMQELPNMSDLVEKLKNDRGFRETTDEKLIHSEDKEYFHDTFNVTGVYPIFVDHSGMVILILDDRGFMYRWDEMSQNLDYLGNNLREGLTNCLYHPEKICAIMEFTCELIPVEELIRSVNEEVDKYMENFDGLQKKNNSMQ